MNDLWSMSGSFIYRHHVEPRVKLFSPREESFPIPLKYIDVTKATNTSLDVMLKKKSTIAGMLMEIENCKIRGQVSQGSLFGMKNHRMDIHGPGGDCEESKRPPDQALCGQRFGKICGKRRNAKKSKSGLSKNRGLTMPEQLRDIYFIDPSDEEFKDIMKKKKTLVESSKCRCQLQCLAKLDARSTGRPVALKRSARQNTLALSKPTSLRESAWKDLFIKPMHIILLEKE